MLDAHPALFTAAELDELRALFGRKGFEIASRRGSERVTRELVEQRQQYRYQSAFDARHPDRIQVAEQAVTRYGLIAEEIKIGL